MSLTCSEVVTWPNLVTQGFVLTDRNRKHGKRALALPKRCFSLAVKEYLSHSVAINKTSVSAYKKQRNAKYLICFHPFDFRYFRHFSFSFVSYQFTVWIWSYLNDFFRLPDHMLFCPSSYWHVLLLLFISLP